MSRVGKTHNQSPITGQFGPKLQTQLCVCSRFYQWYQWYTNIVQGSTNGTIGNTIGTNGNANCTIGSPNGTIGTIGKPMVTLATNGTISKITNGTIGKPPNRAYIEEKPRISRGNKTTHRQDNSPTRLLRQFTDRF